MPPHDRLCRRLNGIVGQAAKPPRQHEPLLFLYPRWFAAVATTTSSSSSSSQPQSQPQSPVRRTWPGKKRPAADIAHGSASERKSRDLNLANRPSALAGVAKAVDIDSRPSNKLVTRIVYKANDAKKKDGKRKSLHQKYTDSEDWRTAFDKLRKHTPQGGQAHVKQLERVEMPEGMTGYYLGDLDKLFLEVYLCTDCHVQISRGDITDEGDRFRALVLVGTPPAIRAAKVRLNDTIRVSFDNDDDSRGGAMGDYQTISTPASQERLRAVWAQASATKTHSRPISDIPLPREWSIIAFANYVDDVTNSKPPRLLRQKMYATDPANHERISTYHAAFIAKTIERLFTNTALHPFISSQVAVRALAFLAHHRRLPSVRVIIESLNTSTTHTISPSLHSHRPNAGHPALTTAVFNSVLASAAHASDLHNYTFLLALMTSRNLIPDFNTWQSLLSLVLDRNPAAAKTLIFRAMREKGLLENPQAKMAVAAVLVKDAFGDWVDRGGSTASFIEQYDRLFCGKEWLDTSVANRMVSIRATRGQFEDALSIVSVLRSRGRRPSEVTLNTLVGEAAGQTNIPATMACLKGILGSDESCLRVAIEERTYTQLFWLAKRTGSYNMARVVWRYACLGGNVSAPVLRNILSAIGLYAPAPSGMAEAVGAGADGGFGESRAKIFKSLGYKSLLGVADGDVRFEKHESRMDKRDHRAGVRAKIMQLGLERAPVVVPRISSSGAESAQQQQRERRKFFSELVKEDLHQARNFRPVLSFVTMLEAAVERDSLWKMLGVRKVPDFAWVLENILQVEVENRVGDAEERKAQAQDNEVVDAGDMDEAAARDGGASN